MSDRRLRQLERASALGGAEAGGLYLAALRRAGLPEATQSEINALLNNDGVREWVKQELDSRNRSRASNFIPLWGRGRFRRVLSGGGPCHGCWIYSVLVPRWEPVHAGRNFKFSLPPEMRIGVQIREYDGRDEVLVRFYTLEAQSWRDYGYTPDESLRFFDWLLAAQARENPPRGDERLRDLERQASSGDPQALEAYRHAIARTVTGARAVCWETVNLRSALATILTRLERLNYLSPDDPLEASPLEPLLRGWSACCNYLLEAYEQARGSVPSRLANAVRLADNFAVRNQAWASRFEVEALLADVDEQLRDFNAEAWASGDELNIETASAVARYLNASWSRWFDVTSFDALIESERLVMDLSRALGSLRLPRERVRVEVGDWCLGIRDALAERIASQEEPLT